MNVANSTLRNIFTHISTKFTTRSLRLLAPSALILGVTASSVNALTITDTFLGSFTGTSVTEAQIQAATTAVASLFSNSATINILFGADSALGNGASSDTVPYYQSYTNYVNLLSANSAANPANTTLATAVANLPNGNGSGTDGNLGPRYVFSTPAQLQALGLNVKGGFDINGNIVSSGLYDGIITVGTTADTNAVYHEIDEILGGGGQGSYVSASDQSFCAQFVAGGCYGALDLYRYSATGVGSFNPNASTAYLSVDGGVTHIADFNQSGYGDYGDFTGPNNSAPSNYGPCLIQSAVVCSNPDSFTPSSPEYAMLQSIGYNAAPNAALVATPLPPSWTMMLAALMGLGLIAYRDAKNRSGIFAAV